MLGNGPLVGVGRVRRSNARDGSGLEVDPRVVFLIVLLVLLFLFFTGSCCLHHQAIPDRVAGAADNRAHRRLGPASSLLRLRARVRSRFQLGGAPWQSPLPESRKSLYSSGMNSQS